MNFKTHINQWRLSLRLSPTFLDGIRSGLLYYGRIPVLKHLQPYGRYQFCYPQPIGRLDLELRNISDVIVFREIFDDGAYDIELSQTPKNILDLGANVGFTSIYFRKRYPDAAIAAVEPFPTNAAAARLNWAWNNCDATLFEAAAAPFDGRVDLEITPADFGHRVIDPNETVISDRATVQVEAISIPSILARLAWEQVDLVKIDIEGYEARLLSENCDWLKRVGALCIECHGIFGEVQLQSIAEAYGFKSLARVHEHTWLLNR